MKKNQKKLNLNLKKWITGCILIVLLTSVFIVIGEDGTSDRESERSHGVSLTVTLHGADSSGIQNSDSTEYLLKVYQRQKELELTELRNEIIELHRQNTILEERCRGLQMRIATLFGNGSTTQDSANTIDPTLHAYGELSQKSRKLCIASNRIVQLMDVIVRHGVPTDAAQLQRLKGNITALKNTTREVELLLSPERVAKSKDCKVIEINAQFEIIVINHGYRQGITPGMSMWIEDGANVTELFVIEVRADIAAAILKQGDWRTIVPGMAVTAGRKKLTK